MVFYYLKKIIKMDKKRVLILLILSLTVSFSLAQTKSKTSTSSNSNDLLDYKVISSNSSYIEIEFTPKYIDDLDFMNSAKISNNFGKPNLSYRIFSFILPSKENNVVEIIESKYSSLNNIEVKPVPLPKKANNKLEFLYDYTQDSKIYSINNFYPLNNINLIQDKKIRDKYIGSIQIYPVIYNPVTKSARKYTYLRIRIKFGGTPVISKKQLSLQEQSFFNSFALNSPSANNWTTSEKVSLKYSTSSILASGDFYKIEVKEDGIYKLDKNYLQNAGIDVSNINPKNIKIYNNGGQELPYNNLTTTIDDLAEVSIYVEGQDDGKFDDGDYILFYGTSPNWWTYTASTKTYKHNMNHYSTSNYYWITFTGNVGSRMNVVSSINYGNLTPLTSFKEMLFDEPEVNNLGSTGTLWVSQRIGIGESFTFNKSLYGIIDNSTINFNLRLGNATSTANAYFIFSDSKSGYTNGYYVEPNTGEFTHINLKSFTDSYTLYTGNNSLNLSINLSSLNNSGSIDAYYDYLEVFYQKSLSSVQNNVLRFFSTDTNGILEYQVSTFNTSDIKVFDVTSYNNAKIITPISYSSGIVRFQDEITKGTIKQYYAIGGSNYKTPTSISSRVSNQNLHGDYTSTGADFIIISPTEFLSAANRLKSYRESPGTSSPNYLKTIVIDVNNIYNEFSGGLQDPVAIRNFLKYAYNNWTRKPLYVLFFGDGSYDYKNIYNLSVKNYIPPIEKPSDSNDEIESYPSDDFITSINTSFSTPSPAQPDFYHGRLNINSLTEANLAIDKIINYESTDNFGIWKKKAMYVGDDGWTTEYNQGEEKNIHTQQCENIAESYTPPDFEKEKIYIVTYPTTITPQGRRKPGANVDIVKGWNEGRLVINYVGHGSVDLWAHEHIFVRDENIPQLTNKTKLPLVTIASCDVLRWDDPFTTSMGEELVSVQYGAIDVIGANRPVYSPNNATFNNALWSHFMYNKDTLNLPIRIGKAMYLCKLQLSLIDNDMKYGIDGDPTVRISIPQYFTSIDSINNTSIINDPTKPDTIKALQKVVIKGRVLYPDSSFYNTYNGDITIKVFDVDKNITYYDFGFPFYFRLDGGTIFKGKTKIVNGKWSIKFIVPKDISYTTGNGKLTSYFTDNTTEGTGYTNKFVLNGIDSSAVTDTTGPTIKLYVDSRNFRSGDILNQNTKIISDFYDISGINLTGAIGHKLEAVLNDNENSKIDLTSYYTSDTSYQYGTIEYPLQNLSDGYYKLKIRAWDTYNNLSESVVNFTVKSNTQLYVDKVYNYPNPFKDNTIFTFQHNLDANVSVKIKIYTVSGRFIKELLRTNITDKYVMVEWDGRDNDGDAIANGTYIYKVTVKSDDGIYNKTSTGIIAKLK
jgi:hypothetical protein